MSEKSLKADPKWNKFIGMQFELIDPMFLVKGANYYLVPDRLGSEHPVPARRRPSFDEFLNGDWGENNDGSSSVEYLKIVKPGVRIEVVDIVRKQHVEAGITYKLYGKIISVGNEAEVRIFLSNISAADQVLNIQHFNLISSK